MDVSQLKAAQDSVVAALRWAEEDQWTERTPCPDWDVRALVDHLITGNERFVVRLAGEQPGPPPDRSDATTKDLVEAYERTNVEVLEAFGRTDRHAGRVPVAYRLRCRAPTPSASRSPRPSSTVGPQQALGTTIDFDEATIADAHAWGEPMLPASRGPESLWYASGKPGRRPASGPARRSARPVAQCARASASRRANSPDNERASRALNSDSSPSSVAT